MSSLLEAVRITTYVNPHLFWVIQPKNEERFEALNKIKKDLYGLKNDSSSENYLFQVGELVAIEINKQMYRAVIQNISVDMFGEENTEQVTNQYLCWLIDCGTMVEAKKMYKLPISLKKTPPLAVQVCLNGIGYVHEHLNYDDQGQPIMEKVPNIVPTSRCHSVSLEILSHFQTLDLQSDYIEDCIHFGDIICKDDHGTKSLKSELIKAELLVLDETIFHGLKSGINDYRETHLRLISKICKNNASVLEEEENDVIEDA